MSSYERILIRLVYVLGIPNLLQMEECFACFASWTHTRSFADNLGRTAILQASGQTEQMQNR